MKLGFKVHQDIANWLLLSGVPRIYDKSDLNRAGFQHIQIPPLLVRYFCNEIGLHNRSDTFLTWTALTKAPGNRPTPKRKLVFQRLAMLVLFSGRVALYMGNWEVITLLIVAIAPLITGREPSCGTGIVPPVKFNIVNETGPR